MAIFREIWKCSNCDFFEDFMCLEGPMQTPKDKDSHCSRFNNAYLVKECKETPSIVESPGDSRILAWGKRLSSNFDIEKVLEVSNRLTVDPSDLTAIIAFETGRTFSTSIKNAAGSGATGLIQFMPQTAVGLGTTIEELSKMTFSEQMEFVYKYLKPFIGRIKTISDMYMAILWPSAVGQPEDYILFDKNDDSHPKRYIQNAGLDFNKDGKITKKEASQRVSDMLLEGMKPENRIYY